MNPLKGEGSGPKLEDVDAGWGTDDEPASAAADGTDDLDAGWDDDADDAEEERPPEPPGLSREERAEREAAWKERARAKAAAKKERKRARAEAALAKQKTKQKKTGKARAPDDRSVEPSRAGRDAEQRQVPIPSSRGARHAASTAGKRWEVTPRIALALAAAVVVAIALVLLLTR